MNAFSFHPFLGDVSVFCLRCNLSRNSRFSLDEGQKQAVRVKQRKREAQRCLCLCTFSLCDTPAVWYKEFHLALLDTHTHTHTHTHTFICTHSCKHFPLQCTGSFKVTCERVTRGICSWVDLPNRE